MNQIHLRSGPDLTGLNEEAFNKAKRISSIRLIQRYHRGLYKILYRKMETEGDPLSFLLSSYRYSSSFFSYLTFLIIFLAFCFVGNVLLIILSFIFVDFETLFNTISFHSIRALLFVTLALFPLFICVEITKKIIFEILLYFQNKKIYSRVKSRLDQEASEVLDTMSLPSKQRLFLHAYSTLKSKQSSFPLDWEVILRARYYVDYEDLIDQQKQSE